MVRSDDVNQFEPNSIAQEIESLTSLTHSENQALHALLRALLGEYAQYQDMLHQGIELVPYLIH